MDRLVKEGIPEKNSSAPPDKSDLNFQIVLFTLKGEITYSRLEININQLRREILNHFSILEVRIFSRNLISTLDDIIISEDKKTIEEIETEVFNAIVSENSIFKEIENDVVGLMKNLKNGLIQKTPNYYELKESLKDWCIEKSDKFKLPKVDLYLGENKDIKHVSHKEVKDEEIESEDIEDEIDLDEYIDDIDN